MKTAIIFLAVALAVFIFLFILSEISLRQEIDKWAASVAENGKLKEELALYKRGKCPNCGAKVKDGEEG